jgi:hypothetical protein
MLGNACEIFSVMYLQRGLLTAENETTTHRTHRTHRMHVLLTSACGVASIGKPKKPTVTDKVTVTVTATVTVTVTEYLF